MNARARKVSERLRWRVAYLLDKSRRFCWADLVSWAMNGWRSGTAEDGLRAFLATDSRTCQLEGAEPEGTCYCGKFRDRAYFDSLLSRDGSAA